MSRRLGLAFDDAGQLADCERVGLLGGKGAALARMVALGLPVPPGFTLTTEACHRYLTDGWDRELRWAVAEGLADLQALSGKRLGAPRRPLLMSIRSGAPVSMPGMMDTVLNAGMTAEVAQGLGESTGDAWFGWDTMRRFVQSYVTVVLGAPDKLLREVNGDHLGVDEGRSLDADSLRVAVGALRAALAAYGFVVPDDPEQQIRDSIAAVFRSWNADRARVYRQIEGIDESLGTAATVQMMAFGNLGDHSGTGVAFSRCPSTGEPGVMGDFLQGAQGEDVVAGTHQTLPVSALRDLWPDVADELERTSVLLERDLSDLADIEFTVEQGKFWLLQVRRGKRSPRAALRIAIDMAEDPCFPLSRAEALARVADVLADPPVLSGEATGGLGELLTKGLAASPGRVVGNVYTEIDDALSAEERGESVILVRAETSPADIAGMAAASGILTCRGGLVSHAAVVARGWGLPAVVGAEAIEITPDGIRIGERMIMCGAEITVDGTTGEVLLGSCTAESIEVPEAAVLRSWQQASAPAEAVSA